MLTGLSLRLRLFLIFAGLAGGILAVFAAALLLAALRMSEGGTGFPGGLAPGAASALMTAEIVGGFAAALLVLGVWFLFDRNVARPIETLAGGLRTGAAPDPAQARYLADLGPAAAEAAQARARSAEALAEAVHEHAADLARDKAVLEQILGDVGAGAVMADVAGRVVFYNAAAARMLPGLVLDRPLARYLRAGALSAAEARLAALNAAGDPAPATDLTCLSAGGVALAGRMRPLPGGTLLMLRDRPADAVLPRSAAEALRRHAAMLVPMLDLIGGPIPPPLAEAIRAEGQGLAEASRRLSAALDPGAPAARASLPELAADLDADPLPPLTVAAEAGAVNALLRHLADRLTAEGRPARLRLHAGAAEGEVALALAWAGAPLAMDALETWLSEAPDPDQPGRSGADLLAAQGSGAWAEADGAGGRIVVPLALAGAEGGGAAGVTADFALAGRGAASSQLSDLTCVVFDTETTGLLPSDRIVQIAGVRIARGRLTGERFETLVNPGRTIPAGATAVHHVGDADVADAPDMTTALTAFHRFAEGAVLVAHNAPFDMGLLRAAAAETGAHFDNRVLDTVLLSAMVFGQAEVHSLDALTGRLGIVIPPEARHTAMGDTIATAEAFLRLIPALEAKGLTRFETVVAEARKHRRLIADANIGPTATGVAEPVGEAPAPVAPPPAGQGSPPLPR